jgi:hypothetical protein
MACWVSPDEFGGYDCGAFGNTKTWHDLFAFEQHHVGPGGMANGKRHQATNVYIKAVSPTEARVTPNLLLGSAAGLWKRGPVARRWPRAPHGDIGRVQAINNSLEGSDQGKGDDTRLNRSF